MRGRPWQSKHGFKLVVSASGRRSATARCLEHAIKFGRENLLIVDHVTCSSECAGYRLKRFGTSSHYTYRAAA